MGAFPKIHKFPKILGAVKRYHARTLKERKETTHDGKHSQRTQAHKLGRDSLSQTRRTRLRMLASRDVWGHFPPPLFARKPKFRKHLPCSCTQGLKMHIYLHMCPFCGVV